MMTRNEESPPMKQHLLKLRERHVDAVMAQIDEVLEAESPAESTLVEMCRYHLETGGKRLRAIIPIAVAEALEADPSEVLPFSAACELLHNATLVHDDLQDGDETRRGEPAVWAKYGPEHAVNAGDAMLYWPMLCLDRLDCDDRRHRLVVGRFARRTLSVIEGQEREFQLKEAETPLPRRYIEMVEGKTGGLLRLALAGAAEVCGASEPVVDALEAAGADLGVLFQIQDDILDLYGEKGRDHRGADIAEGKISALVVHFLNRAPASRAQWLRDLLRADRASTSLDEIERAAAAFREHGSLAAALAEIEQRRRRVATMSALDDVPALTDLLDGLAAWFVAPIAHVSADTDEAIPLSDTPEGDP